MSDIKGDVSPAEFVRGKWSGFHGPVRFFGDLLGMLGPRWSDSRAEGGIVPNWEMEGARRRAASGEGAAAWEVARTGNRAHIHVPVFARRHLSPAQAVLLPGHAQHLIGLCLVPRDQTNTASWLEFTRKQINEYIVW